MNKNGTVMHKIEFLNSNFILSLETLKAHSVHIEGKWGISLKSSENPNDGQTPSYSQRKHVKEN